MRAAEQPHDSEPMTPWQQQAWERSTPVEQMPAMSEEEAGLFEEAYAKALQGQKTGDMTNGDMYDVLATQAGKDAVNIDRQRREAYAWAVGEGHPDAGAYADNAVRGLMGKLEEDRAARFRFAAGLRENDAARGERIPDEVSRRLFEANGMWPQLNIAEPFGAARAALDLMDEGKLSWSEFRAMRGISSGSILYAGQLMNAFHKGHDIEPRFEHAEPMFSPRELVSLLNFPVAANVMHGDLINASLAFLAQATSEMHGEPTSRNASSHVLNGDRDAPEMRALEMLWRAGASALLDGPEAKADSRRYKQAIRRVYATVGRSGLDAVADPELARLQDVTRAALLKAVPSILASTGYEPSDKAIERLLTRPQPQTAE